MVILLTFYVSFNWMVLSTFYWENWDGSRGFVHGTYICLTASWNGGESWSGRKIHNVTLYCSEIFALLGYCVALIATDIWGQSIGPIIRGQDGTNRLKGWQLMPVNTVSHHKRVQSTFVLQQKPEIMHCTILQDMTSRSGLSAK